MKTRERKVIRNCALVFIAIVLLGVTALYIREYWPKNIKFKEVNAVGVERNIAQGNHVLVSRYNGLKTFPVLWGHGLYLYSIDENKFHLLKDSKIPFKTFDGSEAIQGDRVFYTMGFASPGDDVYMKDMRRPLSDKVIFSGAMNYAVTDENIYYVKVDYSDKVTGTIYEKNIRSGEERVLAEGSISYMIADDENIYYYNEHDEMNKSLFQVSMRDHKVTEYPDVAMEEGSSWAGKGETGHIIVITKRGEILDLNEQTGERTKVGKINGELEYYAICKYKNRNLYYATENHKVYKINFTDGKTTPVISLSSINEMKKYMEGDEGLSKYTYYCTDYIVIEATSGSNEYLLIFDYEGNLKRNVRL